MHSFRFLFLASLLASGALAVPQHNHGTPPAHPSSSRPATPTNICTHTTITVTRTGSAPTGHPTPKSSTTVSKSRSLSSRATSASTRSGRGPSSKPTLSIPLPSPPILPGPSKPSPPIIPAPPIIVPAPHHRRAPPPPPKASPPPCTTTTVTVYKPKPTSSSALSSKPVPSGSSKPILSVTASSVVTSSSSGTTFPLPSTSGSVPTSGVTTDIGKTPDTPSDDSNGEEGEGGDDILDGGALGALSGSRVGPALGLTGLVIGLFLL